MAHMKTDVVRTYEFTEADLMARLELGGKIVRLDHGFSDGMLRIVTEMIHPEDSRFVAPPVPGEVCRECGAAPGQQHSAVCSRQP